MNRICRHRPPTPFLSTLTRGRAPLTWARVATSDTLETYSPGAKITRTVTVEESVFLARGVKSLTS
eukprot:1604155-Rhodomonas_salina.2